MSFIVHPRLDFSSFCCSSFSNNFKLSFCLTHEGKPWKMNILHSSIKIPWVHQEVRGVSPTPESYTCQTSLNMLFWNFWACCHVLNLCTKLFSLSFSCQKWVICMLKHRFSLKFHLNWSFLAKVTNRTSLWTFCKNKNLSRN